MSERIKKIHKLALISYTGQYSVGFQCFSSFQIYDLIELRDLKITPYQTQKRN